MNNGTLVIGGSGSVGRAVARRLDAVGLPVRSLSRHGGGTPGVETLRGDVGRPETLTDALVGVSAVMLIFPTLQPAPEAAAERLVSMLTAQGRRIVLLSAARAADTSSSAGGILGSHARLEALIRGATDRFVLLRPSGFATNTLGWAEQLARSDRLSWFFPTARRSLIHEDDLAAVAARALRGGLDGTAPHLTGPESPSQLEQLAAIGAATGRQLNFVEVSPERAHHELFPAVPAELVDSILAGQADFVEHPETVTDTVREITGAPARSYSQWARDHAEAFALRGSGG